MAVWRRKSIPHCKSGPRFQWVLVHWVSTRRGARESGDSKQTTSSAAALRSGARPAMRSWGHGAPARLRALEYLASSFLYLLALPAAERRLSE